ncbi:hypothetical protein PQX77_020075 [Marasmius sp. AFHP31]|nr:hypothetical protein PQX77_020075 [Marasmius sp. AFHP31]
MTSAGPQNQASDAPDNSGWSAVLYNKNASFVYSPAYTAPVLELLNAQSGEKILDFGCGSGELTLKIEGIVGRPGDAGGGLVVGVDFSENMIDKAQLNGFRRCFVADIQEELEFPKTLGVPSQDYDAVFTNAALHWCKRNPRGVISSAKRVLKQGGRFVGEMGGFMNCIGIRLALHLVLERRGYEPESLDPWFFPSTEEYSKLLTQSGFEVQHISLVPRLTPLPAGLKGWLEVFVRSSWLRNFSEKEASEVLEEVEKICRVDCRDGEGKWSMTYVRLRFVAISR